MTPEERELLIEQAASAWRPRDRDGGVRAHPAWRDLDADGRIEVWRTASEIRRLESALDGERLSSTARAVLARITARG